MSAEVGTVAPAQASHVAPDRANGFDVRLNEQAIVAAVVGDREDRSKAGADTMSTTHTETATFVVLASRPSPDPRFRWEARVGGDRGRLEVVAVVDVGTQRITVPALSDVELRSLLAVAGPAERPAERWLCLECGTANSPARSWCERSSQHQSAEV